MVGLSKLLFGIGIFTHEVSHITIEDDIISYNKEYIIRKASVKVCYVSYRNLSRT